MSNYTIKHECCGYTETVNICGKEADRPRKAAWIAKQPCIKCRAKAASESGITEGTDKQVAWAKDIRDKMVRSIDAYRGNKQSDAIADVAIEWVDRHHDARWYIDNESKAGVAELIMGLIPAETQKELVAKAMATIGA